MRITYLLGRLLVCGGFRSYQVDNHDNDDGGGGGDDGQTGTFCILEGKGNSIPFLFSRATMLGRTSFGGG
jgi:hypothetical protein